MSNFFILFFILNWKIESNSKYNAYGGHLNSAIISETDEIVIEEIGGKIEREFNEEVGLNLLFQGKNKTNQKGRLYVCPDYPYVMNGSDKFYLTSFRFYICCNK